MSWQMERQAEREIQLLERELEDTDNPSERLAIEQEIRAIEKERDAMLWAESDRHDW